MQPNRPKSESRLVGRYLLHQPLAEGSMGRVVAATDAETGAEVALKMPLSAEPQLLEYFEREVRTLRSLDHPGVVKLREHGLDSGLPWCAMERLVGPTLREVFKETFQTQKF